MRFDPVLASAVLVGCALSTPLRCDDLIISELLASNRLAGVDDEGESSDWLEIHNRGPEARSLAGYTLSDDPDTPRKWVLPALVVPPRGFCLVWMSGKDRYLMPPEVFRSSNQVPFEDVLIRPGEEWRYLLAPPGASEPPEGWTAVDFDDSAWSLGPSGIGYGDGDDGTEVPPNTVGFLARRQFTVRDPAKLGQLVLQVDYDDGFVAYLNGVRVAGVNSPHEHPGFDSVATTKREAGNPERFDLTAHARHLRSGRNVLAIVGLNDKPSSDMSLIPALGTLPFVPHASFRLARSGGVVLFADPAGTVVDRVEYPPQVPDQSFGRSLSTSEEVGVLLTPTPGARNGVVRLREPVVVAIEFEPAPGRYGAPVDVHVRPRAAARDGLVLRYTLDGAVPESRSPRLEGPLRLRRDTVLRVAGFVGEERATAVSAASFFFGPPLSLPVISIAVSPPEFQALHLDRLGRGRGSERLAHMDVLAPSGELVLSTAFGLRLHGGYGRRGGMETKKSYRAYFRKDYGTGRVSYPLIPSAGVEDYDKVVLRAGFNDRVRPGAYTSTGVRDQIIRDLHDEMGGVAAHGAWYVLYVNMQYLGLYNVTERLDDQFLDSHLGAGEWDVIKTGTEVVSGSREGFTALGSYVGEYDLVEEENYEEISQRVDLEDFTAYVILNLWAQNHDWPHNNWYAFRKQGGKWRFLSWDAEFGMGLIPPGYAADSYEHILGSRGVIRDLFVALTANPRYAAYFRSEVERHLAGALSEESVIEKIALHERTVSEAMEKECSVVVPGNSVANWRTAMRMLVQFARGRPSRFRAWTERFFIDDVPESPPKDQVAVTFASDSLRRTIVYRTESGHLRELVEKKDGRGDSVRPITELAGAPASRGRPRVVTFGGRRLVVYRDADGSVHLLQTAVKVSGGGAPVWRHDDLTALLGAPAAASDPAALAHAASGTVHVAYSDRRGRVHELYEENGAWHHQRALLAPRPDGDISLYDRGSVHIVLRRRDKIHDLRLQDERSRGGKRLWRHTTIPSSNAQGDPVGVTWDGVKHVFYTAPDGSIFSLDDANSWQTRRLPVKSASGLLTLLGRRAGAPSVYAAVVGAASTPGIHYVVYRDAAGRVIELRHQRGTWTVLDLTALTRAPHAAGDPAGAAAPSEQRAIVYRALDGELHELRFDGAWSHRLLETHLQLETDS